MKTVNAAYLIIDGDQHVARDKSGSRPVVPQHFGRFVKTWCKNHARGLEDVRVIVAERASLFRSPLRTGDDVLVFHWLDPKARRKIGQVGDQCDEGPAGINFAPALG